MGRLRIFQRSAVRAYDSPTPALHGAEVHLAVREQQTAAPVVAGRFPVRGLELELPAGTYAITTWWHPYREGMKRGPAEARCEGLAIVEPGAMTSVVRVQDDWTRCHYERGEAHWNVSLRAGRMRASSWWVVAAHEGVEIPFLELGMPLQVSAVFLDVPKSGRKLRVVASLEWEDGRTLQACTGGATGCPYIEPESYCSSWIRDADLGATDPTVLFVQRADAGRSNVQGCLMTD